MGIENPTTRTAENSEPKAERGERDIQAELAEVNSQIDSVPQEDKDSALKQTLERAATASRESQGLAKDEYEPLSQEETERIGNLHELTEKRSQLQKERNEFYKSNPEALKLQVKELYKNNLRAYLNANPEEMDNFIHGRLTYFTDPKDSKVKPVSNVRNPFKAEDWFVRLREGSKDYREYSELSELLPNEHAREDYSPERAKALTDFIYSQPTQELHDELTAKERQQTYPAPAQSFQERVTPQTAEFMTNHILDKDLAYQDAELPEEQKEQMLNWSRSSESAKKYAESLANASTVGGLETVRNTARQMRDTMISEATRLGIPVSPHGKSTSWAMWDTGKQYHFFTHQDENQQGYEIGNPIESESKRDEIINRQLGWEAYAAFRNNHEYRASVTGNPKYTDALELFNKVPKATNGTLSSRDLAELGKALRRKQ